jgi:hypothetical protein
MKNLGNNLFTKQVEVIFADKAMFKVITDKIILNVIFHFE